MSTNNIIIKGLKIFANHGVLAEEKKMGQDFLVDVVLHSNLCKPMYSDRIEDAADYSKVCKLIGEYLTDNTFDLIERVAYGLSKEILVNYPIVESVDITLHKPNAPIAMAFNDVEVNITNKWSKVYLSIGSNIGDRQAYVDMALCKLNECQYIKDVRTSDYIETEPYGYVNQDKFLNGAIELKTVMNPYDLLHFLNGIENTLGRVRKEHWGPRTIDLDIIFYDDVLLDDPDIMIPHIDMANREFVLKPLMELCPNYVNQRTGMSVADMLRRLEEKL